MRKSKVLRLLSGFLAMLTLFGGFSIVSGAEKSKADSYDINDLGGLTDILETVKYADYLQRYDAKAAQAGSLDGVSPISIDVAKDYSPENTSALCREDQVHNVICNTEVLSYFFDPKTPLEVTKNYTDPYLLFEVLSGLESYRFAAQESDLKKRGLINENSEEIADNAIVLITPIEKYDANGNLKTDNASLKDDDMTIVTVTGIKVDEAYYTEAALRLVHPKEYHDANPDKYPTIELTEEEAAKLDQLELILDFLGDISRKFVAVYGKEDIEKSGFPYADELFDSESMIYLPDHDAVGFKFTVEHEGYYNLNLRYFSVYETGISKKTSIERSVYLDGAIPYYEATYVSISKTYVNHVTRDGKTATASEIQKDGFLTDINGNEIRPTTDMEEAWRTVSMMDSTGSFVEPLKFYLTAGEHVLQLFARRESVVISYMEFAPASTLVTYEDYLKQHAAEAKPVSMDDFIRLEAEYPEAASDNTIYPTNDRTSCITSPQHPSIQYLNTLGGSGSGDQKKWSTVGQWVRYKITVPTTGFYKIAFRFSQTTLQGSFVSRQLRVQLNSEMDPTNPRSALGATVPFAEAYYLQFNYGDDWQIGYMNNGETEFSIFLEEGDNIVELEANLGDMSDIIRRVTESLNSVNDAYIKFLMLAGSSPDADRDYGFYRRIPSAVLTLSKESRNLYNIAKEIETLTGTKGSHVATLEKVAQLLERMGSDESEIAGNLDSLKGNLGTLGTWISDSKESPLELDYILVAPGEGNSFGEKLPKATPGFLKTLWFECKMFVASFTTDYNTLGLMHETSDDAIIVWTTTGRDQANIIRSMINNDFTTTEDIAVNLKLVAGGSLLPSVLAGVGPDVSMGHGSSDAINWAIRSALVELTDMGTAEYCRKNGYTYEEKYDANRITGFENVIREFHNEEELPSVDESAWFSSSAVIPMTLHEVITKENYEKLSDDEKNVYSPYDVQYYYDITKEEYDLVDRYEKKYYTAIRDEDGRVQNYRFYVPEKTYNAMSDAEKALHPYVKSPIEYYEKFSLWGLPQEQSFNMMFYRADIFNELGLTPPKTWDDLYAIIGVLQSNNMEIAMPGSLGGYEMFLYQMGGDLYSNGGQTISFDENLSIEAFEVLCNFFQSYKFPISYDFSNRFRSGEIPMGILGYTSYTQLSVFATEIKGMWEFVPLPGYKDPVTGVVNNDSTSGSSGIIMLKGARDRNVTYNSWKFMVWFTSKSAQSTYASEVTAVLGTESKHPTANKEALKELPWTSAERDNLLSQFDNLVGIPEYPGGYIISRYVNFAFLAVYNDNADPITAIQEYVVTINAELTRKRQEFDLAYKDVSYSN